MKAAESVLNLVVNSRASQRRTTRGDQLVDVGPRLLRIGRTLEEATRILGAEDRAAGWLRDPSPMFYDAPPLTFLDSDGGSQAVYRELMRINYGRFA